MAKRRQRKAASTRPWLTQWFRGKGRQNREVRVFADWRTLLALNEGDGTNTAAINALKARLAACTTAYCYLNSGLQNTYAGFVTAFDALSAEDKLLPLMANVETPWLDIITWNPSLGWSGLYYGAGGAWEAYAQVVTEFTRQGLGTPTSGTPIATFKACAERLWYDCTNYAHANGCPCVLHYASPGWPMIYSGGGPIGAFMYDAQPKATKSYLGADAIFYQSLPEAAAYGGGSDGGIESLMRAQRNAGAHGVAVYQPIPTQGVTDTEISQWDIGSDVFRRISGGSSLTPKVILTDLVDWLRTGLRGWFGQYDRAIEIATARVPSLADCQPQRVAGIIFPSPWPATSGAAAGQPILRNHWSNKFWSIAQIRERVEDICGALFDVSDRNVERRSPPDDIWIWDQFPYYMLAELVKARAVNPVAVDSQRCEVERLICNRPKVDVTEPIGSTVDATKAAWWAANCLTDFYWTAAGGGRWWRADTQVCPLPAPCVIGPGLTILDEWLDYNADIYQPQIMKAWGNYLQHYGASMVEEIVANLTRKGYKVVLSPHFTRRPSMSAKPESGRATTGISSIGFGTITGRQWYTALSVLGTLTAIGGATGTTYSPVAGDIGKYLVLGETVTSPAGVVYSTYEGPVTA